MMGLFLYPQRRPGRVLLLATAMVIAALLLVTRFRIDTSLENLFSRQQPAARAMARVLNNFGAVEELLILASTPDGHDDAGGLTAFAERVERAVKASPEASSLTAGVLYRVDPETREFFQKVIGPNGLFYLDDAAFAAARQRLARQGIAEQVRRDEEMMAAPGAAAGALSKVILQDPLRLHEFILDRIAGSRPMRTYRGGDLFVNEAGNAILIRVRGRRPVSDIDFAQRFTRVMQDIARDANASSAYHVEFSGGYAIAAESAAGIRRDMIEGIVFSVVALQALFFLAYRRGARAFLLAFIPVAVGILWGFGAYAIGQPVLTPMTAVIGGILAGMGIDYSIQFLSHYAARRRAMSARDAAIETTKAILTAKVAAWFTSVIGFIAIATSEVKALRDFAVLGTLALTGAFLAATFVLPALLVLVDRKGNRDDATTSKAGIGESASRLRVEGMLDSLARRNRAAMSLAVLVLLAAVGVIAWPGEVLPLESDLTVMHPHPNHAFAAQADIAEKMGVAPGALVVHLTAASPDDLVALAHDVEARLKSPAGRAAEVTGTYGLATLLPDPRVVKRRVAETGPAVAARVVADFRAVIADSVFDEKAYAGYEAFLNELLKKDHAPGVHELLQFPDLARTVLPRDVIGGNGGAREAVTWVFLSRPIEQRAARDRAVQGIRAALSDLPGATLTGLSVLSYDAEQAVRRDLPRLLWAAGIIVALYLALHFRNPVDSALALLPTAFSLLVMLAVMRLAGQRLNMVNLVAFPLLIGIDVDYGIFIVSVARWRQVRRMSVAEVLARVAPSAHATILCAAATLLGFGSLVFTRLPAERSLGIAVIAGVVSCVFAAFFLLIPMLVTLSGRRGKRGD